MNLTPAQYRTALSRATKELTKPNAKHRWMSQRSYAWLAQYIVSLSIHTRSNYPVTEGLGFEAAMKKWMRPGLKKLTPQVQPENLRAGQLVFFSYKATTVTLFDKFPCTMILRPPSREQPNHYFGVNLHYAPPLLRFLWFDYFLSIQNLETPKPQLLPARAARMVKRSVDEYPWMKHCYKTYRIDNMVARRALVVPESEWIFALAAPVAQFTVPETEVWEKTLNIR